MSQASQSHPLEPKWEPKWQPKANTKSIEFRTSFLAGLWTMFDPKLVQILMKHRSGNEAERKNVETRKPL
jgi:hypothetical protein